jgi:hypothetical protein
LSLFKESGYIFAGTSNGMYRLKGSSSTWTKIDWGIPDSTTVNAFTMDTNRGTLFAGTTRGVFYSWDEGNTWTLFNEGLPTLDIASLAFFGNDVYAGVRSEGIWHRSRNDIIMKNIVALKDRGLSFNLPVITRIKNGLIIEYYSSHKGKATIEFFNSAGRKVSAFSDNAGEAGIHRVYWNVQNTAKGIYTLRIKTVGETYTRAIPIL